MTVAARSSVSFDDYLQLVERDGERLELVGGQVYAISDGTERHGLLAGLLFARLLTARSGCRVFKSDRILRIGQRGYLPDVMVVCGPAAAERWENDARLIVEVSSDSTESVDTREKAEAYLQLPGIDRYVLVEPRGVRRVRLARKVDDHWEWSEVPAGGLVDLGLTAFGLDELYDEFEASITT